MATTPVNRELNNHRGGALMFVIINFEEGQDSGFGI